MIIVDEETRKAWEELRRKKGIIKEEKEKSEEEKEGKEDREKKKEVEKGDEEKEGQEKNLEWDKERKGKEESLREENEDMKNFSFTSKQKRLENIAIEGESITIEGESESKREKEGVKEYKPITYEYEKKYKEEIKRITLFENPTTLIPSKIIKDGITEVKENTMLERIAMVENVRSVETLNLKEAGKYQKFRVIKEEENKKYLNY
jgi:hypothetical protein